VRVLVRFLERILLKGGAFQKIETSKYLYGKINNDFISSGERKYLA